MSPEANDDTVEVDEAVPPEHYKAVAEVIDGNTTRNIGAGRRIKTVRPQTGLGARLAVIPLATANRVRGNSWADRAAICPAVPEGHPASAIAAAVQVLETERVEAEQIA